MNIKKELEKFLKGYKKILILTVGNELRGDDGLGPAIAKKLSKNGNFTVIDGGTVPENFTGKIKKENPTHIIIIDAVEMGAKPGTIKIIEKDKIANYNISTHAMPLSFLIDYLQAHKSYRIILIGIQPKRLDFSTRISEPVRESMGKLISILNKTIQ
ncbi:MAG TPA: hydrogenase maturation peptidase HycI [Methanothermobacter sp.]|jgi:hydrogenase 3 maturation protease|uniref:Hydrogenase 3 maturation endopeptidase HyCI n=1 Tax=Methanothermobacter tenebrarum TaxID=680118 RepID=A0ABN6PF21_9EURY|nr:hydrogenase maturation peptidase HycI [Methanothermobacter tenebrarum]MDD3454901.1 hydrogenase maturation peptidase HycI [Methanobacteriales archaeon]MDI6881618.1 hydrogenase maturation peptidase HycI [Methanothermobacter sp.]MDX9693540.1 hydrogenase maturation peptidase HycI [Methanothermobacter sp.]BDH79411.1 hydrogenase 3 maturation endopeptidase HyCI [Methanothermobacter tenebrarum]HHW16068.1 hydrogenase maturation peptidase HycI [Methanothermobacter sp.]